MLSIINEATKKNIAPIYTSEREGDIKDSYMTYEKINSKIGWKPEYDIYEGIKETIESFK